MKIYNPDQRSKYQLIHIGKQTTKHKHLQYNSQVNCCCAYLDFLRLAWVGLAAVSERVLVKSVLVKKKIMVLFLCVCGICVVIDVSYE